MTTHLFLSIFAALILLILSPPTATGQAVNEIFDMEGNIVQVGTYYNVLPVVQRRGGGISMTQSCPPYIIQETNTTNFGIPVQFTRAVPNDTTNVMFSNDMNINFRTSDNFCRDSTSSVWKLKPANANGTRFVGLGGKLHARGPKEVDNWFRIERFFPRFNFDYKFVYCPNKTICPNCEKNCGDLGVYVQEDGSWRLGVGAPPLRIKFRKVQA